MRKSTRHYIQLAEMAVDDIFADTIAKQYLKRTLERKLQEFMNGILMNRVPHSHKGYIAGYIQGHLKAFLREHVTTFLHSNIPGEAGRMIYYPSHKRYS